MLKNFFVIISLLAFYGFANAESRLQQIQESGKLRVGTTGDWNPMSMKDSSNNTILSGQVQNVGEKRADFSKITFTIYKDQTQQSSKKEYTAFVLGSMVTFNANSNSNSSLYPSEVGTFSVTIPNDFGPFMSYSYYIDWEEYE